ncbi:hypothetical protein LJR289_001284 [Pseudoduganella sp. LjRoot289]|uniref:hypothetical protein n=1 Tax=Pseudoduganella sp. LjRoot289 TaxID=3342314 RepID=UPI003ECC4B4A
MTARKASNGAAFNKMPVSQAIFRHNRINDLQQHLGANAAAFCRLKKYFSSHPTRAMEATEGRPIESFDKNAG